MSFKALAGKSVWITGASSGIGLELALLAAESGAHLILLSSRQEALAEAARLCSVLGAASVHFEAVDFLDTNKTFTVAESFLDSCGAPDYLILNAGISQRSMAGETDLDVTRRILEVNFYGAINVTRTVLPAMVERRQGRIGVTSSLTGVFGFPLRSSYAASKHALHGYFETLRLEYASSGISTTMVMPGRIRTSISLKSLKGDGSSHGKKDPGLEKGMDARHCAQRYWRGVIRRRHEVVIGGPETFMVFLRRRITILFRFIARQASPV